MATHSRGGRRFPALVIVFLLFLACLFPGQYVIADLFPRISGLATINPGLTIFDIPVHLQLTIDLILVPGLFLLAYAIVLLLYPFRQPASAGRQPASAGKQFLPRMGALLAGTFLLLFCTAAGYLLADLLQDHLPREIRNGIDSLGINADIALPLSSYKPIHLRGDIFSLLCLIVGITLFIRKINRNPNIKKATPLTREQRMTPYERMLRERKAQGTTPQPAPKSTRQPAANNPAAKTKTLCHNEPLLTLEPEAVGYMPMG